MRTPPPRSPAPLPRPGATVAFARPLSFLTGILICREFLGQGWMKVDKSERTPYIMKTSQHFNDVRLRPFFC